MESTSNPPDRVHRQWTAIALVVIALACLAAYHNTFDVPEVLDDATAITENSTIRQLWPIWPALNPPPTSGLGGRPVANLSFALNYWAGGTNLRGYHALNLAIHICAGLLLFGIARRTLRTLAAPGGAAPFLRPARSGEPLALAIALLWTTHPLLTASVTYLSQRTESLMGLFFFLTIYGFIRARDAAAPRAWLGLAVLACAAGMATKEVMVTAPLMVLLYDRTFAAGSFVAALRARRLFYSSLAATWLLLPLLMRDLGSRHVGYGLGVEWWRYALTECRAMLIYLKTGAWPHPLVFDYGPEFLEWPEALPYVLVTAALIGGVIAALRFRPRGGFLGAWFFGILAPSSSVVPVALQPIAENRLYLPLAALIAAVVLTLHQALGRRSGVALALAALGFVALAERRNEVFQSPLRLWSDTLAKRSDNPRAHDHMGQTLRALGRLDEAIAHYREALALNPNSHATHSLIGDAYREAGRFPEAIEHYSRAIALRPGVSVYHNNLAVTFSKAGEPEKAIEQYQHAVQLDPQMPVAHANLGVVLHQQGRLAEAATHFQRSLEIFPENYSAQHNLGLALLQLGRVAEAIPRFEAAIRLNPGDADVRNTLGVALMRAGRTKEAQQHLREALRLDPTHDHARRNLEEINAPALPAR